MTDLTGMLPVTRFTLEVLTDCAQREVRERRRRFPNRILTGRMSHAFAREEIDKMVAIAEILHALAQKEKLL